MKILELFLLFSSCECERWLLLGGYTGFEGEDATAVRNEVELIELTDSDEFSKKTSWCQRGLPSSPESLDGATVDMINTFKYMEGLEGDPKFSSAHNSVIYDRVLVCGGSDNDYGIRNMCR